MPSILKTNDIDVWIDPTLLKQSIIDLMLPHADEEMAAYTVSKDGNSSEILSDREDTSTRVEYEPSSVSIKKYAEYLIDIRHTANC